MGSEKPRTETAMVIDYRIFCVWRMVDGRESGHFVPVAIMSNSVATIVCIVMGGKLLGATY